MVATAVSEKAVGYNTSTSHTKPNRNVILNCMTRPYKACVIRFLIRHGVLFRHL